MDSQALMMLENLLREMSSKSKNHIAKNNSRRKIKVLEMRASVVEAWSFSDLVGIHIMGFEIVEREVEV